MQDLSFTIQNSMNTTNEAYKVLMRLNSSSEKGIASFHIYIHIVLRMYASFLIDVMNRPEEANIMLRRADELEEAAARTHKDSDGENGGLLGDRTAIISISSAPTHIGEVIDMNVGAVRLIGHSKSELLHSNVSKIVPAPYSYEYTLLLFLFRVHHDLFIKRYLETGNSRMMNTNNFIIALHKNGYLLPIEFFLRVYYIYCCEFYDLGSFRKSNYG